MSGRIRSIKPEILEDDEVVSLSDEAWRLWVSMFVLADDFGNLPASERFLASRVWQDSSRRLAATLGELRRTHRVELYAVDGRTYAHICNWEKHQRIDNAGKKKVPLPDEGTPLETFAEVRGDSPRVAAGLDGIGRDGIGGEMEAAGAARSDALTPEEETRVRTISRSSRPPPPAPDPEPAIPESVEPEEPAKPESGYDLAKRVFGELWSAKYRRPYKFDPFDAGQKSEKRVLQLVGNQAIERGGQRAEEFARQWAKAYLRDHGNRGWLDDNEHPARAWSNSMHKYADPPAETTAVRKLKPAEPVAPALSAAEVAAKLSAIGIGRIGNGGAR